LKSWGLKLANFSDRQFRYYSKPLLQLTSSVFSIILKAWNIN
jgi:hypothetical protein